MWKANSNKTKSWIKTLEPNIDFVEKIPVFFSEVAHNQIKALCDKYTNLEWLAGLKGRIDDTGILITNITLYEQEVNGAHVELTDEGAIEMSKDSNIGWIHSHNNMNVFFSGEDIQTAKMNDVSIVVNNKDEYKGIIKVKFSDKITIFTELEFHFTEPETKHPILDIADKLIKEESKTNISVVNENIEAFDEYDVCVYCQKAIGAKNLTHTGIYDDLPVHKKCRRKYETDYEFNSEEQELTRQTCHFCFCTPCMCDQISKMRGF